MSTSFLLDFYYGGVPLGKKFGDQRTGNVRLWALIPKHYIHIQFCNTYKNFHSEYSPTTACTFGVHDCDDFWQMGEEQYFTYVTSHICQTIGESAQSGTPNACIFSPLVAHPVPPLQKLWGGVWERYYYLQEELFGVKVAIDTRKDI